MTIRAPRIISTSRKPDRTREKRTDLTRPDPKAGKTPVTDVAGVLSLGARFHQPLVRFLSVNLPEPHVLDRYDQAPPQPGTALTACAGFAVFSLSLRQIPACCTCGAGAACVDCTDFGYRYSAWRVVVGDLAGRNRRLAASRQYPQESRGARGRHAARRVARAWTDPAAIGYAFHHDHLRAAGSDCRRLCVSRHRQARVYRVADGHYDDHRRGTRRPVDRGRTVAHLDGADRDCDSARVFVRAAAIRHLFVALSARRQHA